MTDIITYLWSLSLLSPQYPIHRCLNINTDKNKVDYSTVYSHIFAGILIYIDNYMRKCEEPICAQYSNLYQSYSQYINLDYYMHAKSFYRTSSYISTHDQHIISTRLM
jgi:hypothetical protein